MIQRKHKTPIITDDTQPIIELALHAFRSSGFLAVNKKLVGELGLIPAVLMSNYIDKFIYFRERFPQYEGWFFLTHETVQKQLQISRHTIREAKRQLIQDKVIITAPRGTPSKEWIWIDFIQLMKKVGIPLGVENLDPLGSKIRTPIKETKDKEKENIIRKAYTLLPPEWEKNIDFDQALKSYISHRWEKNRSSLTQEAVKRLSYKLRKYPIEDCIQALNKSSDAGWTGVFPESVGNNGRSGKTGARSGRNRGGYSGDFDNFKGKSIHED